MNRREHNMLAEQKVHVETSSKTDVSTKRKATSLSSYEWLSEEEQRNCHDHFITKTKE